MARKLAHISVYAAVAVAVPDPDPDNLQTDAVGDLDGVFVPVPEAPNESVVVVVTVGVDVEDGVLEAVKVVEVLAVVDMVMEAVTVGVQDGVLVPVLERLAVADEVQDPVTVVLDDAVSVAEAVIEAVFVCDKVGQAV